MNINCLYTDGVPKSKGKLQELPVKQRGVLIGFTHPEDSPLYGIVVTEIGKIILIPINDIKVV